MPTHLHTHLPSYYCNCLCVARFFFVRESRMHCAIAKLRQRSGVSEVDNAQWDCFRERKQKARPPKQSRDALSSSLFPSLQPNIEMAMKDIYRFTYSNAFIFRPDKTLDASVLNSFKNRLLQAVCISLYKDHNLG